MGSADPLLTGNIEDDFDDKKGGRPCNTQQETNTRGNDDCMMVFPDHDTRVVISVGSTPLSGVLVSLSKELVAQILDVNCSPDKLRLYKDFLSSGITKKNGMHEGKKGSKRENGVVKCG